MLKPVEFYTTVLVNGVGPSDTAITVERGSAQALDAVGIGNHCYLVLTCGRRTEVVKYTLDALYADRTKPDTLAVTRDFLSTGAKSFAPGSCVNQQWFGVAITEWVAQSATSTGE